MILGLVLLGSLMASCFHLPGRRPKADAPVRAAGTVTPPPKPPGNVMPVRRLLPGQRIGTVRAVGTQGRFVLVEVSAADRTTDLTDGQLLRCVSPGGQAAVVRVARERRPPFVVADVISGEPRADAEVFFAQNATVTVPLAPPSATTPPPAASNLLFPLPAPTP